MHMTVENNCCPRCSGRGFDRQLGKILNRRTGEEIATTYQRGPNCSMCGGSGQLSYRLSWFGWLLIAALALVVSAFVIQPALHLFFD